LGVLHGIPMGIKDIVDVEGMWTRAGCEAYTARVAESDAPVIRRLKAAGAIILGKTETTAFANNDPTITRNPWNPAHTPGGSSSGSGAAVADRMCLAALGSQTGGSLIRPAAYNGIVGFKQTYGYVSLEGVIPVSWSLDHVGPHARCLADAVRVSRVIREDRPDPFVRMPAAGDVPENARSHGPPRLGFMRSFIVDEASDEVKNHLKFLRDQFQKAGAAVVDLALPESFSRVLSAHQTIFETDLACYHRESFASRSHQYPPKIKARIEKGLQIPGYEYVEALRTRAVFQDEIYETLSSVDAAFMPAASTTAPHGLDSTGSAVANVPWSFSGFPAISLPSGMNDLGLPFGVQIVGLPWADETLSTVAFWCERALAFDFAPAG
jgi:aspartyl-tRNA(Asn)/glutamyl-tRNA(Gln) amidotransferase subunit A